MARNFVRITIHRRPHEVFPWLVVPDLQKRWIDGLVSSVPLTNGTLRVGARARDVLMLGSRRYELETEILELEPNRVLVLAVSLPGGYESTASYRLEPHFHRTRLAAEHIIECKHLLARIKAPFVVRRAGEKMRDDQVRLRRLVESSPVSM
jgi:uncharacterized protein YndB with AHSA1/START domain